MPARHPPPSSNCCRWRSPVRKSCSIMTDVPYMSSAGLRLLLSIYRQITSERGAIALGGRRRRDQDTMAVTGFLKFFVVHDTVDGGCRIPVGLTAPLSRRNHGCIERIDVHPTHTIAGLQASGRQGRFPSGRRRCPAASISRSFRASPRIARWCCSRRATPSRSPRFPSRTSSASAMSAR